MYKLIMPDSYLKKEKQFFKKHPDLKDRYKKILILLITNPHYPSLRLHKLKGNLKEYYSISLTMKYRIKLDIVINDKEIIFIDIGTHDSVY